MLMRPGSKNAPSRSIVFAPLGNTSHGGRLDAGDFATLDRYRHTTLRLHMLGAIEDRRIQEYRYVGFSHELPFSRLREDKPTCYVKGARRPLDRRPRAPRERKASKPEMGNANKKVTKGLSLCHLPCGFYGRALCRQDRKSVV